jgi:hypothetical protein
MRISHPSADVLVAAEPDQDAHVVSPDVAYDSRLIVRWTTVTSFDAYRSSCRDTTLPAVDARESTISDRRAADVDRGVRSTGGRSSTPGSEGPERVYEPQKLPRPSGHRKDHEGVPTPQ